MSRIQWALVLLVVVLAVAFAGRRLPRSRVAVAACRTLPCFPARIPRVQRLLPTAFRLL